MKRNTFAENVEWNGAFPVITSIRENPILYEDLTLNWAIFLKFWTSDLSIIEWGQKIVQMNYKVSCMCTFKHIISGEHICKFHLIFSCVIRVQSALNVSHLLLVRNYLSACSQNHDSCGILGS